MALREAREAANLTQQQVADEMEWSLSKVIRIENGDVSIAPNDLRPLLAFLGLRDRAQINDMVQDAKVAKTRQRTWWQAPVYREHLTDSTRRLFEYEAEATLIRYYSIYYIPGPLQIPDYSAALMDSWDAELPAEQIAVRLQARRVRRESFQARLGPLKLHVLLDESVLRRTIGGEVVFAEQLRELLRLAEQDFVRIRVVPFSLTAPITNNASFDLLSLGPSAEGDGEDEVLYRETGLGDELIEDKATTSRHHSRYEILWRLATNDSDTIDFIRGRLDFLDATITNRQREPHR